MKGVHRLIGLIFAIILVSTMGSYDIVAESVFPEATSIPGLVGLGYTNSETNYTSVGSLYAYHVVSYSKSWEPAPWTADARIEMYQIDTDQIDFYEHQKIIDIIALKDNVELAPAMLVQPNFNLIEDSESPTERALGYTYFDYFYQYPSADAELDSYDATLDESDRLGVGRYVIIAEPFAFKIEIKDVPATEFQTIKTMLFDYAESLIGTYQPSEQAQPVIEVAPTVEDDVVHDMEVHVTYSDAIVGEAPSNNQHIIIGIFDANGNYIDSYNNITDKDGVAKFAYAYPIDQGYTVKVAPVLDYRMTPDQPMFLISDGAIDSQQAITLDCGDVVINQKEDLMIWCRLENGQLLNGENYELTAKDYIMYYNRLKLAIEYYSNVLSHKPTQDLPLRFVLNGPTYNGAVGYFDIGNDADIFIGKDYSSSNSAFFPGHIFHELSHYMMYDIYDTKYPYTEGNVNHAGYINPSTADSFSEGFAFFMEQYLQEAIEKRNTNILGTLDTEHVAWDGMGKSEPMAFASLLYDLLDGENIDYEADDQVELRSIWQEIFAVNNTVADFYEKIIGSHPTEKEEIDRVFIQHGFFACTDDIVTGAGIYNTGEPFIDDGPTKGVYDVGEKFIDYYDIDYDGLPFQVYKVGAKVGSAAYKGNPIRERFVPFPGQFIKVDSGQEYFDVQVSFEDAAHLNYSTRAQNVDGKMYVHIPPKRYNATISIVPEFQPIDSHPLVIVSEDYYSKELEAMALGYFYEANFDQDFEELYIAGTDEGIVEDELSDLVTYNLRDFSWLIRIAIATVFVIILMIVAVIIVLRVAKKSKPKELEALPAVPNKNDVYQPITTDKESWTCQCGGTNVNDYCSLCGGQKTVQESVKRFCTNCGTPFEQNSKFCAHCGNKL